MSFNFNALKKSSGKDLLSKINKSLETLDTKRDDFKKDDRLWRPTTDAAGNSSSVIRFLPNPDMEQPPLVKTFKHAFQENGKWFIEECPSMINQPCPVCEDNGKYWNSGIESDKEIARKHKRQMKYVANVFVIKDPAAPENEGKTKLFFFGAKIMDKIKEAMNADEDAGDTALNPFDIFDGGGNFLLKTSTVAGYLNYDKSKFVATADFLGGDEEKITEVMGTASDLTEFSDPSKFKSYDKLKERFAVVTGAAAPKQGTASFGDDGEPEPAKTPVKEVGKVDEPAAAAEDDDMSFFKNLANS